MLQNLTTRYTPPPVFVVYLDDIYIAGKGAEAAKAFDELREGPVKIGLDVNNRKCKVHSHVVTNSKAYRTKSSSTGTVSSCSVPRWALIPSEVARS